MRVESSKTRLLAIVLLLSAFGVAAAESGDREHEMAASVVGDLQAALLESMRAGESLDFAERRDRLRPVVRRTHHFGEITRFILGRHARELDEQQLTEIAGALSRLSVAEYASRFNRYNGERLRVINTSAMGAGRVVVETELTRANGEIVHLEYMLQQQDGSWGIVNVVANGVSDLALKRGEYSRVLSRDGYEALLARLRNQAAEIRPR